VIVAREVIVLVHRGGEALVLLRSPDAYWHVVAGAVEEGESFRDGAVRELLEETGLDAADRVHALRRSYSYALPSGEVQGEAFGVEAPAGWEPVLNEEHSEYRWCSFADAAELVRWRDVAEALVLLESRVGRPMRGVPRFGLTLKRPRSPGVFFLRFPTAVGAEDVAAVPREDGYEVAVEAEPAHWLVTAHGRVRPDSFDVAEQAPRTLAEAKGGRYAGCRRRE